MGGDEEFSWKPFIELNRETVEVLGDKVITDLVSDDEEGFGTPPTVVLEKMMPLVARKSQQGMHLTKHMNLVMGTLVKASHA
jgi:hypothetical protein